MSSIVEKKYYEEITNMLGKQVRIETETGSIVGILLGLDPSLNAVISQKVGDSSIRVIVPGRTIKMIALEEEVFDLKALADRLSKVFPGMVKLREDIGAIIVMDKIKVTKSGVVEGTGPSAEKVKQIYESYVQELQKK